MRWNPPKKVSYYTIIILYNFRQSVKKYFELGKKNTFPRPDTCPSCKKKKGFRSKGFYDRYVIDITIGTVRIVIKRYTCKVCGKTISILPTFLTPYRQHTVRFIYISLILSHLANYTQIKTAEIMNNTYYQNIQHWRRAFKKRASVILTLLYTFQEINKSLQFHPTKKKEKRALIGIALYHHIQRKRFQDEFLFTPHETPQAFFQYFYNQYGKKLL